MTNLTQPTATPLYDRLGGAEGIASLVDDIVDAHMSNPAIRSRFLPFLEQPARLEEIKRHLREFIDQGSGGPGIYSGASMPDTHRGMNISEAEYVAAIDDILAVLDRRHASEPTRKDVLAILYSLKEQIVRC